MWEKGDYELDKEEVAKTVLERLQNPELRDKAEECHKNMGTFTADELKKIFTI